MKDTEKSGPRVLEYPFEYFDVQVKFAKQWSQLSGEPLSNCLTYRTALYKRLVGNWKVTEQNSDWKALCQKIENDPEHSSAAVMRHYSKLPNSKFIPPLYPGDFKHFGSFGHDYYPPRKTVKIHFLVRTRGYKSQLAREFLEDRREDLKQMFTSIREHHPEAETVLGGSWLYNLEAYRRIFPPSFTTNMKQLLPPNLSLSGNSVWGQFIDSLGGPKLDLCHQFLNKLTQSKTTEEMIHAFPYPTYQTMDGIDNFYRFLGI